MLSFIRVASATVSLPSSGSLTKTLTWQQCPQVTWYTVECVFSGDPIHCWVCVRGRHEYVYVSACVRVDVHTCEIKWYNMLLFFSNQNLKKPRLTSKSLCSCSQIWTSGPSTFTAPPAPTACIIMMPCWELTQLSHAPCCKSYFKCLNMDRSQILVFSLLIRSADLSARTTLWALGDLLTSLPCDLRNTACGSPRNLPEGTSFTPAS